MNRITSKTDLIFKINKMQECPKKGLILWCQWSEWNTTDTCAIVLFFLRCFHCAPAAGPYFDSLQ